MESPDIDWADIPRRNFWRQRFICLDDFMILFLDEPAYAKDTSAYQAITEDFDLLWEDLREDLEIKEVECEVD